jgi:hypothetical protein
LIKCSEEKYAFLLPVISAFTITDIKQREARDLKLQTEDVSFDAFMTATDKARLALLMPKITSFTLQKIKQESAYCATSDLKSDCDCKVKVNFNLRCQHVLPPFGPIPLSVVAKRWHLDPTNHDDGNVYTCCELGITLTMTDA